MTDRPFDLIDKFLARTVASLGDEPDPRRAAALLALRMPGKGILEDKLWSPGRPPIRSVSDLTELLLHRHCLLVHL